MKTEKRYEFALSVGQKRWIETEGFAEMKKAGVSAIELSFDEYDDMDFEGVKALSAAYGIALWSLHLPFMPFETIDISSLNERQRQDNIRMLCGIMEKACGIGIGRFVIHASGEPVLPPDRAERMKRSMDSLDKLSEFIKSYGAVLAVENLPRTCLGNTSEEINRLTAAGDNLTVCFDTNHLLLEQHRDFVPNLNKKIETVHISDYDFAGEKHWLPTVGKIDWREVIGLLDGAGYTGPWLYEVSFRQKTADGEKTLTLADFRENYQTLFGGEQ